MNLKIRRLVTLAMVALTIGLFSLSQSVAAGVRYINGKTTDGGATFQAEITGESCFAN